MTEPIVSLDTIKTQARDAAAKYSNVNEACPYPFGTAAGQAFKEEFLWARLVIEEKGANP